MKVIKTLVCRDGVIGLNGWQYVLDHNDNTMKFQNTKSANSFLLHNGFTQEHIDELIEIEDE